jgi:predicted ABC-type ATPase
MLKNKPVLIVIAGPNGSGKTTITNKILKHEWVKDCIYINPDQIALDKFGDWNSIEATINAANFAAELREKCLSERVNFIFETVFSAEDKIKFIEKAIDLGYFIRFFFVSTNHPTINASRVASRVLQGGHDVPIKKIIDRYYKSILNCSYLAPQVDRLYIYDNSIELCEAKLLFRASKGIITKEYFKEFEWAKKIYRACEIN